VNFIDTYQRTGLYPVTLPLIPGLETSGTIAALGDGVTGLTIGDRIMVGEGSGGYAEQRVAPADRVVPVPDDVDLDVACALPVQALTAHYLHTDTFPLAAGDRCLIHAGAGGTGRLLIQMAKRIGAEVFTTVGTVEKADIARRAGADHVIIYSQTDFADAVRESAGAEHPLDVVYDGVGAAVFEDSLGLLRPRGMMVTFGNASGAVDPVSPLRLSVGGSLFLTRPTIFHYIPDRESLLARAGDVFEWLSSGELTIAIDEIYDLADAGSAHDRIESRGTTGKLLLRC
jgi:NADPH2:quinone reductase